MTISKYQQSLAGMDRGTRFFDDLSNVGANQKIHFFGSNGRIRTSNVSTGFFGKLFSGIGRTMRKVFLFQSASGNATNKRIYKEIASVERSINLAEAQLAKATDVKKIEQLTAQLVQLRNQLNASKVGIEHLRGVYAAKGKPRLAVELSQAIVHLDTLARRADHLATTVAIANLNRIRDRINEGLTAPAPSLLPQMASSIIRSRTAASSARLNPADEVAPASAESNIPPAPVAPPPPPSLPPPLVPRTAGTIVRRSPAASSSTQVGQQSAPKSHAEVIASAMNNRRGAHNPSKEVDEAVEGAEWDAEDVQGL